MSHLWAMRDVAHMHQETCLLRMLGWVYSFWVHAAVETCNVNDKCEVVCVSKSVYIFKYIYTTCLLMHMCDLEPQVHAISENCMHLRLEAVHQIHDEYTNISHIHIYMNNESCHTYKEWVMSQTCIKRHVPHIARTCGSRPCTKSTTSTQISHSDAPRDLRFENDSCPGVSITNNPGIL